MMHTAIIDYKMHASLRISTRNELHVGVAYFGGRFCRSRHVGPIKSYKHIKSQIRMYRSSAVVSRVPLRVLELDFVISAIILSGFVSDGNLAVL